MRQQATVVPAKRAWPRPRKWLFTNFCIPAVLFALASCAGSVKHDETLAARRAIEFAQFAFIDKNFEKAYELLSDGGKRHLSLDKFKETGAAAEHMNPFACWWHGQAGQSQAVRSIRRRILSRPYVACSSVVEPMATLMYWSQDPP